MGTVTCSGAVCVTAAMVVAFDDAQLHQRPHPGGAGLSSQPADQLFGALVDDVGCPQEDGGTIRRAGRRPLRLSRGCRPVGAVDVAHVGAHGLEEQVAAVGVHVLEWRPG